MSLDGWSKRPFMLFVAAIGYKANCCPLIGPVAAPQCELAAMPPAAVAHLRAGIDRGRRSSGHRGAKVLIIILLLIRARGCCCALG